MKKGIRERYGKRRTVLKMNDSELRRRYRFGRENVNVSFLIAIRDQISPSTTRSNSNVPVTDPAFYINAQVIKIQCIFFVMLLEVNRDEMINLKIAMVMSGRCPHFMGLLPKIRMS